MKNKEKLLSCQNWSNVMAKNYTICFRIQLSILSFDYYDYTIWVLIVNFM